MLCAVLCATAAVFRLRKSIGNKSTKIEKKSYHIAYRLLYLIKNIKINNVIIAVLNKGLICW